MEPRVAVKDTSSTTLEYAEPAKHPIQPSRTEQSKPKELNLVSNCVNFERGIINCHHTLSLSIILPLVKGEIVISLYAGQIEKFIENWPLITQDPWVLQTVQGFQLPLVGQPTQITVAVVPSTEGFGINRGTGSNRGKAISVVHTTRPDGICLLVPIKDRGHRLVYS